MALREEIEALQRHLSELTGVSDDGLAERYRMRLPRRPPGLYWQLRWLAGLVLRSLEFVRILPPDPWPVSLRRAATGARSKPLLIWAVGTDRATLRAACHGFAELQQSWRGFAPVLVTDVADFAFFSRLGWLVEFVPSLSGEGLSYDQRKATFLARLYRGAPVFPASVGLAAESGAEEIRRHLAG